ncbi:hypothetical protein [Verrucomicrobium sp. BvORR106]|uniref:hypothetical protein n=1 Tax=Verrucomicrobium sp. BvORR106 TaxID=1403819 RepID=UPI0005702148|nr:hypothetical protein [Verrucomicrobium sp. BvORR106]
MKPFSAPLVRSLFGVLAALMILPALPAQAEGPIDHLKKRRRQIHEKIGEIFFGLGRKIEDAADRVEGRMEPVPPPPPGYRGGGRPPHRDDPYWEEEDPNWELELRYEQRRQPRGPGLSYPDGTPYPDAGIRRPTYRDRDLERERAPRDPYTPSPYDYSAPRNEYRAPTDRRPDDYGSRSAPLPSESPFGDEPKSGVPSGSGSMKKPGNVSPTTPAPMPERKAGDAGSVSNGGDGGLRYGRPVPGKQGFVYPPGVKEETKNMIDVRDFRPGQKVKDPRTGEIFLVP